jgi:hypothetical protein
VMLPHFDIGQTTDQRLERTDTHRRPSVPRRP